MLTVLISYSSCAFFLGFQETPAEQAAELRDKQALSKMLILKAEQYIKDENYLAAKANYSLALKTFSNPVALDGLGVVEFYLGNFFEAQKLFIKAFQTDPKYYNSLVNLAFLYHHLAYFEYADKTYKFIIQNDSSNYRAKNNYASLKYDMIKKNKDYELKNESIDEVKELLYQAKSLSNKSFSSTLSLPLKLKKNYRQMNDIFFKESERKAVLTDTSIINKNLRRIQ